MDEISKKVLIDIQVSTDAARAAMKAFAGDVGALKTATDNLGTVTENSDKAINELTQQLAQSKLTTQQYREEVAKLALEKKKETIATQEAKKAVVAAKGSYNEAQQALTKLGKEIRAVEGGFNNTTPAIRRQIAEYNKLNTSLKNFDAEMGNHQRKVGEYERALSGLEGILARLVPGFGQFSSVLKTASQSFGFMPMKAKETEGAITSMAKSTTNAGVQAENAAIGFKNFQTGATAAGEEAQEAEVAVTGLTGAAVGLTAGFAAVVVAGIGVYEYFKNIATFSDALSDDFAGLKASWNQFLNNIRDGNLNPFSESLGKSSDKAKELNQEMIELNRNMLISDVASEKENQFIATQMLKMRNLHTTSKEAEQIFKEVQETAENQYQRVSGRAWQGYQTVAEQIKNMAGLTRAELAQLMNQGVIAAESFKRDGKNISDDLIKQFADFQKMVDGAEAIKDQIEQRAQNREDQKLAKNQKAAEAELSREQREAEVIANIKRESDAIESQRIDAIAKTAQYQSEIYTKELSQIDENYRQKLFKLKEFIQKQQVVIDSRKSTAKEKNAARGAIGTANRTIGAVSIEHNAEIEKSTVEHNRLMLELAEKAANDLQKVQISAIQQDQRRELAGIENEFKAKEATFKKANEQYQDSINKLHAEIENRELSGETSANSKELQALKTTYNEQMALMSDNYAEFEAYEKKKQKDVSDTNNKFDAQNALLIDQINILKDTIAQKSTDADKIQEIKDKVQSELQTKGLQGDKNQDGTAFDKEQVLQKIAIVTAGEEQIDAIVKTHAKQRADFEKQLAQDVANTGFQILKNNLASSFQAQQIALERGKNYDLQNQALTATQRYEIEEKYRVKEGQLKVKQFRQEQKLAIAQALINGALAITKVTSQLGILSPFTIPLIAAETALEVATIAAQKPPAYAKGGTFTSDGKGAVLPGYSKNDDTNAHLRSGEAVIVSEAVRDPFTRSILSAINESFGGRPFVSTPTPAAFASGGVFSNYIPTADNGLRPQMTINTNNRMHPDDIGQIVNGISGAMAGVQIVTDVKDVNRAQSLLSYVTDRLSH